MSIDRHDIDRHIDLALRREADAGPPPDFAASVARIAAPAFEPAIDRLLLRSLVAAFVLAGLVVVALYGRQWLPAFGALPLLGDATAMNWAAALLACMGLSWALGRAGAAVVR